MNDIIPGYKADRERARAEAVIGILIDWAEWQRGYSANLGYPSKSCGIQSGYVSASFDELCEASDKTRNEIVEQCIDDLVSPAHRAAIHHRYLSAVYRMRDYENSLAEAHVLLTSAFRAKGVLW